MNEQERRDCFRVIINQFSVFQLDGLIVLLGSEEKHQKMGVELFLKHAPENIRKQTLEDWERGLRQEIITAIQECIDDKLEI